MVLMLLMRTRFLDVETQEQGVDCRIIQTPLIPQTVVRPGAEVVGVQRPTTTPPPQTQATPSTVQGTQQPIPQIPLHSFGRGRGAIMIAQLYNHQLQQHYLEYQEQQAQQQQLYLQQQLQLQQQQQISLADLPELEPIGQDSNFEDTEDAEN
jgi:hypothetical protein